MVDTIRERYRRWQVDELLVRYPGLRIMPTAGTELVLSGELGFRGVGPNGEQIDDKFEMEICVPADFPPVIPTARECRGRIPLSFHKLEGNLLCLGAPTALRLTLTQSPTLVTFVEKLVLPYLFGFSYSEKYGTMPFGELAHGDQGILEYLAELFGSKTPQNAQEFIRLASLQKRHANKLPCPCGSGRRLGRCHHLVVNKLRTEHGRPWFNKEYKRLVRTLDP